MLIKSVLRSINLAHISLAFVGLMWTLPFLYYRHDYPITTFHQEWGSGLLGLCAALLLLTARFWQSPNVPRIVMLPIGLLLLLLVQFLVGRVIHVDYMMLVSLYFLFAAMMMMLGRQLDTELGLAAVVTVLAVFLLVGAELNMLAGILQHYRWHTFLDAVVTAKTSSAVYGNLAQPNHYASYLAFGMVSLGLLFVQLRLRIWQVVLLAAPMLFVMALSGSRSAWLYFPAMIGWAWFGQRHDRALRPLFAYGLAMLLGFIFMNLLLISFPELLGDGGVTAAGRLFNEPMSGGIRFYLWQEGIRIFTQFPIIGAGWGQFAYQHFLLAGELRHASVTGLYNHAHNLVIQIAAEGGVVGLVILFGTLGAWGWKVLGQGRALTAFHWWGFTLLTILGIHSMLEYPLWYAYFIGVAALLLGLFDITAYRLQLQSWVAVAGALLLGGMALAQMWHSYQQLEESIAMSRQSSRTPALIRQIQDGLTAIDRNDLLGSYAELYIASMMGSGKDQLEEKLAVHSRALRFIPIAPLAYRQALLLAHADRAEAAKALLQDAIWAYPSYFSSAHAELAALAEQDPARFTALLEFATREYEEHRRVAVSAK